MTASRTPTLRLQVAERFGLDRRDGVLVLEAEEGDPAARAGFRRGDVLTAVDRTRCVGCRSLLGRIRRQPPGDLLTVTSPAAPPRCS